MEAVLRSEDGAQIGARGPDLIDGGAVGPIAQRLYDTITRIQYGLDPDPRGWRVII